MVYEVDLKFALIQITEKNPRVTVVNYSLGASCLEILALILHLIIFNTQITISVTLMIKN